MRTQYCLITEENKKVIFGLSYFSESFYLVRHIFSESGLFDLHDRFGNLVRQFRYIKSAKHHFDLSCIPLFLNVASTRVVQSKNSTNRNSVLK